MSSFYPSYSLEPYHPSLCWWIHQSTQVTLPKWLYSCHSTQVTLPMSFYPSDSTHVTLLMNSWIHELYSTLPNSFTHSPPHKLPTSSNPPPISHETPSSPYAYLNSNHPSNNPINDPLRDNAPNYQQKNEKKRDQFTKLNLSFSLDRANLKTYNPWEIVSRLQTIQRIFYWNEIIKFAFL